MGEAKRRQKLDSNFGKTNIVQKACQFIDAQLRKRKKKGTAKQMLFCVFSNDELGCTEEELKLLEKEIPKRYQNQKISFWVLPKKYAHLNTEEACNHFVPVQMKHSHTQGLVNEITLSINQAKL